jgi:acyl dehydratase
VTEADVVTYAGLSGDFNPLHTDEEYSKRSPYGARIAHGPLVMALGLGLIARLGLTDGTSLGILGLEDWRFTLPVKLGDTITAHFTISSKRMASTGKRGILSRTVEILNQRGEVVQRGTMVTMVAANDGPGDSAWEASNGAL